MTFICFCYKKTHTYTRTRTPFSGIAWISKKVSCLAPLEETTSPQGHYCFFGSAARTHSSPHPSPCHTQAAVNFSPLNDDTNLKWGFRRAAGSGAWLTPWWGATLKEQPTQFSPILVSVDCRLPGQLAVLAVCGDSKDKKKNYGSFANTL